MSTSIVVKRPAVRFVLLLGLGILLAGIIHVHLCWVLVLTLLTFVLPLAIAALRKAPIQMDVFLHMLVVLIGFSLQSLEMEHAASTTLNPVEPESIKLQGWIEGEPVLHEKKMTFVLKTETLKWGERDDVVRRRILVTLRGIRVAADLSAFRCGSKVVARATLEPFPFQRNPGEYDYGRYLVLNGIQGVATIAAREDVIITKASAASSFNAIVGTIQRSLYTILDRYYSTRQAGFLKGVLLGYRADLSTDIKQSFMNTGTIHILAVSGLHVGVIALIVYAMISFLRLPKKFAGMMTILGLVLFMFITGARPSVVRATIMASVILIGTTFERKPDVYNSLSVAAIIILLLDSNALFDVGFQLSFAAVLSIVYIYPILKKLIDLIPERFEEIKSIDYVLSLFAVSLSAQIGTLPFTAYYFGRVSFVSLLANLIVVPLSGLNVMLGVATIGISLISPFIASLYAALNGIAIDFLLGFVTVAGNAPYAYAETPHVQFLQVLLYYGIIAIILHATRPRAVKWAVIVCLALVTILFAKDIRDHRAATLRMTVIDVGQGDAILIETPNHRTFLVDAGPRQFNYDAGERIILPLLHRKGIKNLDALVVTHSHSDHIGGVPFLVSHMRVSSFMEADVGASSYLYRTMKDEIRRAEIPCAEQQRGERIVLDDAVRLYVLHPKLPEDARKSLNNTSVVVKLVYGNSSALLVGDAENEAEAELCSQYGSFLASTILKVGHHGSGTSSSGEFLRLVKPGVALVSVGMRNKFGHPSPATVARILRSGSLVHRTDREGALVYESDGYSWWEYDWRNDSRIPIDETREG